MAFNDSLSKLFPLFETAILEVLPTVSGISVFTGNPLAETKDSFVGVLPLTGDRSGLFLFKSNEESLRILASCMTGTAVEQISEMDMRDCVGELANMICGLCRARATSLGIHFTLASPFCVRGYDFIEFTFKKNANIVSQTFLSDEISFKITLILC